jgi:hypothetical protein
MPKPSKALRRETNKRRKQDEKEEIALLEKRLEEAVSSSPLIRSHFPARGYPCRQIFRPAHLRENSPGYAGVYFPSFNHPRFFMLLVASMQDSVCYSEAYVRIHLFTQQDSQLSGLFRRPIFKRRHCFEASK